VQVFASMSERMDARQARTHARRVEAMGYDGLLVPEAVHDGFLIAMAALSSTRRLRVVTSVLVAFPRSPMTTAIAAWDLQGESEGRFELGLGTQVRGNIVGRYSTAWAPPVPRMREYVESLRAIFDCFQTGEALEYEGEHYQFDRLQPFFDPGPLASGPPPILLGAVGPLMTQMAGGTADGLITHPTNSAPDYLARVILPRIAEGASKTGRSPDDCPLTTAGFIATGRDAAAVAQSREAIRRQLAFLYSTPAYWPSLEHAGFGEVGRPLRELSKGGRWDEMAALVGDDMIDAIVPSGCYADIAKLLIEGFGSLTSRITFPVPDDPAADVEVAEVIAEIRGS
jgi:probable F420-dependent oxidoreductase